MTFLLTSEPFSMCAVFSTSFPQASLAWNSPLSYTTLSRNYISTSMPGGIEAKGVEKGCSHFPMHMLGGPRAPAVFLPCVVLPGAYRPARQGSPPHPPHRTLPNACQNHRVYTHSRLAYCCVFWLWLLCSSALGRWERRTRRWQILWYKRLYRRPWEALQAL